MNPTVAIGLPRPASTTTDTSATFNFTASDNWAGTLDVECQLDGGSFTDCTSPKTYTGLSDAAHTFTVRATDVAGNTSSASYSWTVFDTQAPAQPELEVTTGSLIFEYTSTDDHTLPGDLTFQCRLDGAPYAACSSPTTYTTAQLNAMTPGNHTFQVRAIDEANNIGQPTSHTFTVADITDPNTSITGNPQPTTTNTTASFTFSGADDGTAAANLTFECKLDTGAWEACTSAKTYSGLAATSHTFSVRATDAAGNTDESPASFSWTIEALADTTAPNTSITQEPPATTTETTATFAFSSTETGSTFACKLDTGAWAACTTPKTYTGLTVGPHTFSVRATDAAGNTDQSGRPTRGRSRAPGRTAARRLTLTATADAWIDSGSPANNKGSDSILKVMSKSGGNLRAVVRFTLPTMPQGCSSRAPPCASTPSAASAGRTLQAVQLAATWTEGGVTWANQPATTGVAVTTTSGTGYRDWNVASAVQAMITGSNHGFLIRDATENQDAEQQFHSREKSNNRPVLVLRFGNGAPPPPPPGSGDTTAPDTNLTGNPRAATAEHLGPVHLQRRRQRHRRRKPHLRVPARRPGHRDMGPCTHRQSYTGLSLGVAHLPRAGQGCRRQRRRLPGRATRGSSTRPRRRPSSPRVRWPRRPRPAPTFHFQSPETGTTFECSLDQQAFAACTSPKAYTGLRGRVRTPSGSRPSTPPATATCRG